MEAKLLVVDDDVFWCEVLQAQLTELRFQVEVAYDVVNGLKKAYSFHPHAILLDLLMPGMDGQQACSRFREISDVPIIILTGLSSSMDIVECLNSGADDYVIKTVPTAELVARIRAVLRRAPLPRNQANKGLGDGSIFAQDNLRVDLRRREVSLDGKPIKLTSKEFDLLSVLIKYKGRVLNHEFLLTQAWGVEHREDLNSLRLYIGYLRRKLEKNPSQPRFIQSEWGVGYLFT